MLENERSNHSRFSPSRAEKMAFQPETMTRRVVPVPLAAGANSRRWRIDKGGRAEGSRRSGSAGSSDMYAMGLKSVSPTAVKESLNSFKIVARSLTLAVEWTWVQSSISSLSGASALRVRREAVTSRRL